MCEIIRIVCCPEPRVSSIFTHKKVFKTQNQFSKHKSSSQNTNHRSNTQNQFSNRKYFQLQISKTSISIDYEWYV